MLAGAIVADWIAGGEAFPAARPDAALSAPVVLLPPAESAPRRIELAAPGPFAVELEPGAAAPAGPCSPVLLSFSRTFFPAPGDRRAFGAFVSVVELR